MGLLAVCGPRSIAGAVLDKCEDIVNSSVLVTMFKLGKIIVLIALLCHWFACCWGRLGHPARYTSKNERMESCEPGGPCEPGKSLHRAASADAESAIWLCQTSLESVMDTAEGLTGNVWNAVKCCACGGHGSGCKRCERTQRNDRT